MAPTVRCHLPRTFDALRAKHVNTHGSAGFHVAHLADHLYFRLGTGGNEDRLLAFFFAVERLLRQFLFGLAIPVGMGSSLRRGVLVHARFELRPLFGS